jgi:hypothetical protein
MEIQNKEEEENMLSNNKTEEIINKLNELKEPIDEVIPIVNDSTNSIYTNVIKLVKLMLLSDDKFNEIINKIKITISPKQNTQIKNILNFLVNETNKHIPLDSIIIEILKILSDNKVELYEIPLLINIIHESLKNYNYIKISTSDIGILIKLILFILIETKTIKISDKDYELISIVIDSSLVLLNKSIKIKINKFNKCICF